MKNTKNKAFTKKTRAYNTAIKKIYASQRIIERGKEFLKVPLQDVEALAEQLENIDDIRAYDQAKADNGESFPHDVMKRIVRGESPMKVIREWRNLTQSDLAKAVGSKPAYISQIETGNREGSLGFMALVAEKLDVPLGDLVV